MEGKVNERGVYEADKNEPMMRENRKGQRVGEQYERDGEGQIRTRKGTGL